MAFDIDSFYFSGYSPDNHAFRDAEKEANLLFASDIAQARAAWEATPQTQELWALKGPEPRRPPYQETTYYYRRRLDEDFEEGPRMEEARRRQAADFAAWEEYLVTKRTFEAEQARLKEIALAIPEAGLHNRLLAEREEYIKRRKVELKAQYTAAWAAAGHPRDWLA